MININHRHEIYPGEGSGLPGRHSELYKKRPMPHRNNLCRFHQEILISLFLALVTFILYWQVHHFDFIIYDDGDYVTQNSQVQNGITVDSIIWAFTSTRSSNWHPLTWLSHMLDCQLFGLNPGGHHLSNLFLHIANTLLLFLVFRKMTGKVWESGFVAALFALHPLHIQSVVWIAERKDVLSTFFWMLTTWSYLRFVKHQTIYRYFWVFLFFIFGLLSKPMVVTLPFTLLLLDYWPLHRFDFQRSDLKCKNSILPRNINIVLEKLPLIFLAGISCIITFYAQKHGGAVKSFIPADAKLANILVSYIVYILKMFYPFNLAVFYPYHSWPVWEILSASILLVSISFFTVQSIKQHPYFIVGWLWFLGTLVPVIGLVQVGVQSMADRYTYIPLIGLFIIIAWGASEFFNQWRHKQLLLATFIILIPSVLAAITWKEIGYWKNSITLFEHALDVNPGYHNYISHSNLGLALLEKGRIDEGIAHLNKALACNPQQSEKIDIYNHIGIAFEDKRDYDQAIQYFQKAVSLGPDNDKIQYNLGTAYLKTGDLDQAILHLQKAATLNVQNTQAFYNLGDALFKKNDFENAEYNLRKTIELDSDHEKALQLLGAIAFKNGDFERAEEYFKRILKHNPSSSEIYNYLGAAYLQQKAIDKAIDNFKTALKYDPNDMEAKKNLDQIETKLNEAEASVIKDLSTDPNNFHLYYQLGDIYHSLGMYNKSLEQYQKTLLLQPNYIPAMFELSILYSKDKKYDTAISYLEKIIAAQPDNPTNYYNVACMYAKQNKTKESLEWLQKAFDKGYANWNQINNDHDLKSIRNTFEFKQIVKKYK